MGDHPQHLMIGDSKKWVTRNSLRNICNHLAFISQIKPKKFQKALVNNYQAMAMHEELNQSKRKNIWTLLPKLNNHTIIGTRWVFRSKIDENDIIIRNKSRLIARGYNQEEGRI